MIIHRLAALKLALPGLILAAALAFLSKSLADAIGQGLAWLPKLPLSPVLCAVAIGMLWRNTLGVAAFFNDGLNIAMHTILRTGIALVGLKLTVAGASAIAATALPVVIVCISMALIVGIVLARFFGVSKRLGALLAVGTAVCGATAVIAVSPVIRARNVETAFAITCVIFFGCTAMLCYPWVAGHFFGASPLYAGVFLGTAIHDTSQVIGSALIYSQQAHAPDALAAASVTKLLRNLSIAILIPAAAWWERRQPESEDDGEMATRPGVRVVPFFVIGFILFIALRTVGDAFVPGARWEALMHLSQSLSDGCLICGMAAVGLSVSLPQMWRIGIRPLAAGMLLALTVGACSLGMTLALQRLAH